MDYIHYDTFTDTGKGKIIEMMQFFFKKCAKIEQKKGMVSNFLWRIKRKPDINSNILTLCE